MAVDLQRGSYRGRPLAHAGQAVAARLYRQRVEPPAIVADHQIDPVGPIAIRIVL
jgi:hypothetical protein